VLKIDSMGAKDYSCEVCSKAASEKHHIIFRSQCKALVNCELNHSYLCSYHHRNSKVGVHFNKDLDRKLKLRFQNKIEVLLDKQYFTRQEIQEVLNINNKATDSLCKTIKQEKGVFSREECLKAIMGGRIIEELEDIE